MTLEGELARLSRGWRGPALAALIAFLAGLPGLLAVPPLDRDESRFAQATAQMLESGDFTVIRYQEEPRFKKPVGIHWLQAASVSVFSSPEARQIWAYRIPSLLGAMLAAAACAWGASAFFGAPAGLLAGAMLGATFMLSTEALIAKTDATLCGVTTLALAALGRIYAEARGGPPAGRRAWLLFWIGVSVGTLVKGPVTPMVAALTIAALTLSERRAGWLKRLNWLWGVILLAAVCGPWAWAVTVATDGGFWSAALGGDLAPKLAGGQESHGAPPGYHALLSPLLMFPMTLLLPAAAVTAWRRRGEPGVRFALCWLIPTWLVFEALPTKLVHYTLPTYGAVAWLAAAALTAPIGKGARWTGAAMAGLFGVLLAGGALYLVKAYGDASDLPAALPAALFLAGAGLVGGYMLVRQAPPSAAMTALALGVAGHATLAAGLAPRLRPLWLSARVETVMAKAELLPEQGIADAPVTVAGYAEPSLVFALGTPTELAGPEDAAQAISEHRPAVVEQREEANFEKALAGYRARAHLVAAIKGLDYSDGKKMTLRVYEAAPGSPQTEAQDTGGQP
ncbi:MAG TPA: glycosyltransferase family 39 protein [Phenylobacterium sp.]|jgi:4-amino-4-deoxy-L-arabinose transferase-like glycosyltransferase|uniref:ArnT family glycosyltransferase n=1 Tax=Phenylobacterium sp. TaxID=1871053 RepID=UPI002C96360A|nr:glycosyltransferase family 39 protein [Phenylobacterium sp.]HXA37453.1 glycosyltransferase family 39 protein [Phenylobacterium sp.]